MTALTCILDRRGADVLPHRVERLGDALAIYGDAASALCAGPLGVVVRHRRDDRARERHGPIRDDRSGLVAAVAGRFGLVDPSAGNADPDEIGCARWALHRWAAEGPAWLDRVAGSFTLLVADPDAGWVELVRDHLGDLKVNLRLTADELIASTEAGAIAADPAVAASPDEHAVARFLGFRFNHTGRSFFRGISELSPGHRLRVTGAEARPRRYWSLRPARPASDTEVPEAFLAGLEQAVAFHLRDGSTEPVALSLSGGLDSTALAAVAPAGIRAYSWTFETTPDPAERANIEAVAHRLALPVRWVDGDPHLPLDGDFIATFVHPSSPYVNAFSGLKRALYRTAAVDGCRRVMVGDGGDTIYGAASWWLRDTLSGRRSGALASLVRTSRSAVRGDPFARSALRRLAPVPAPLRRTLRRRRQPAWLTPEAAALLEPDTRSPILPAGAAGERLDACAGARNIELESEERRLFFQCRVERANPFWHRPLIELAAGLPAWWLHRDGVDKVLVREAMRGRLPDPVRTSGRVGLLGGFFLRGILRHREALTELLFRRPKSDWQRYVRRDWLEPQLDATDAISFGHTILWRTLCYELWVRKVWGSQPESRRIQSP